MPEVPEMERGRFSAPIRNGREVHRKPQNDNSEIHRLLMHFENVGCELTPRFLGLTPDGAERLTYLEGSTGYPPYSEEIRSDDTLVSVAKAIRRVHDDSLGFEPGQGERWHGYDIVRPRAIDCIGHYDLAPWNFVFDGTTVKGIIDWDTAGPSNRVWDLAYAAHQFVPFHSTETLGNWGWDAPPDREKRLRLFLDSYTSGFSVQGAAKIAAGDPVDLSAADVVDAAVLRLYGIGVYLDQEVARGNPAFDVHKEEGHAAAYRQASRALIDMRDNLI